MIFNNFNIFESFNSWVDKVNGIIVSLLGKQRYDVKVDDSGFRVTSSDGETRDYPWAAVNHVGILTTSDGPLCEDVYFVVKTDVGAICITHSDATQMDLLQYFDRLDGFKWDKVVEAMCCCVDASFPCWDRISE